MSALAESSGDGKVADKAVCWKLILIDEYDAPLNERENDKVSRGILAIYEPLFSTIKSLNDIIELVYVTGITSYGMARTTSEICRTTKTSSHFAPSARTSFAGQLK